MSNVPQFNNLDERRLMLHRIKGDINLLKTEEQFSPHKPQYAAEYYYGRLIFENYPADDKMSCPEFKEFVNRFYLQDYPLGFSCECMIAVFEALYGEV